MATLGTRNMTHLSTPVKPGVRVEIKSMRSPEIVRVQESWVASWEKRVLIWIAERTPTRIGPDHLTLLGLLAQVGAGACYALAFWNRFWLLGVIACLALNWLGDS